MNQWEGVMQNHAKSFHLASLFFPKNLFTKVKALYALCRWLDDSVDEAPNKEEATRRLSVISSDLHSADPQFPVTQLYRSYELNVGYIQDLIEGAQDDLKHVRIANESELIQYCYKVAGSVGLAMFDLMGVEPKQARAHAVDLGIAMQITNICRDVREDLERDRIYIPQSFLKQKELSPDMLSDNSYDEKSIQEATDRMLALADVYYKSASQAFNNIPWRARGPIIIASRLYRGIGLKLRRKGANPMLGRTYLNGFEKAWIVTKALFRWTTGFSKKPLIHNPQLHQPLQTWKQLRSFH